MVIEKTKPETTEELIPGSLSGGAVLHAVMSISCWRAQRAADEQRDELAENHNVRSDMLKVRKHLMLPGKNAYSEVVAACRALRDVHMWWTVPYLNTGGRMLPSTAYWDYCEAVEPKIIEVDAAADRFDNDFISLRDNTIEYSRRNAKKPQDIITVDDYPPKEKIRSMFGVYWDVLPISSRFFEAPQIGGKLPMERVLDSELAKMNSRAEKHLREAFEDAGKQIFARFKPLVERMVDRLSKFEVEVNEETGKRKIVEGDFRDSLITNLEDLLEMVPHFNLTRNPEITEFAEHVRQLCVAPDVLKECDRTRDETLEYAKLVARRIELFQQGGI